MAYHIRPKSKPCPDRFGIGHWDIKRPSKCTNVSVCSPGSDWQKPRCSLCRHVLTSSRVFSGCWTKKQTLRICFCPTMYIRARLEVGVSTRKHKPQINLGACILWNQEWFHLALSYGYVLLIAGCLLFLKAAESIAPPSVLQGSHYSHSLLSAISIFQSTNEFKGNQFKVTFL